jgi:hypothetical protein
MDTYDHLSSAPQTTAAGRGKFPLASSVGGGAQQDVVVQLTSNLTPSNYSRYRNSSVTVAGDAACRYTDTGGTARRTSIHITMLKITRQAVAGKLASLAAAGCLVDVVYNDEAMLRVNDDTVFNAFEANFQAARAAAICKTES